MSRTRTPSLPSRVWIAALLLASATSAAVPQAPPANPTPTSAAPATPAAAAPAEPAKKPFTEAELASLLAPIALYPDNVIAQILMASTYPIEVIEAHRWQQKHKELKGDALYAEVQKQEWDDSVKSLVNAPDVLKMMDENLAWMQKIGDAFLAQQKEVFEMVQTLRNKAVDAGTLKSNEHMKVSSKPAEATATATATTTVVTHEHETPPQVIVIESSNPEVVYVPTYSPTTMYGAWGYPAYPPYYYPPPVGYPGSGFWFGMSVGIIAGGAWGGGCCWGGGDVDINWNGGDINIGNGDRNRVEHNRGDRTTNRTGDRASATNRTGDRAGATAQNRAGGAQGGGQKWSHNPEHRKGASYRDNATASKFGDRASTGASSRDSFRGRSGDTAGSRPSAGTRDPGSSGRTGSGSRDPGSSGRTGSGSRDPGSSGRTGSSPSAGSRDVGSGSRGSAGSGSRGSSGGSFGSGSSGRSSSSYGGSRGSSSAFGGMSSGSRAGSYGSRGGASRGGGGMRGGGGGRRR